MLGTIVNAGAVILGGTIGIFLKKNMPERVVSIYFQAIGLFTLAIGITMVIKMDNILIVVGSIALGSLIGEWINLEKKSEILSEFLKFKLKIGNEKFSEGLITAFLLFCIGSMTIVGAVDEGVRGTHELLFTKSFMDFFSALLLATAFGIGVVFSSIPLLLFQGIITLAASVASNFFTPVIIQGLTNVGGILLIGLGINILEIKKLRIMNMLPSLLLVILLLWLSE